MMKLKDWIGVIAIMLVYVASVFFITSIFIDHDEKGPRYKCVEGYKFTASRFSKQILNENGGGIPCNIIPNTLGVR